MKAHYQDILTLTKRAPLWFDENGVPRYCDFAPRESADIYAQQVVLMRIRCQSCARKFDVCLSWCSVDELLRKLPPLDKAIKDKSIHYGDPPNVNCCPAGPTMNSVPERVLQFWRSNIRGKRPWTRLRKLEVDVEPTWANEEL